MCVRLHSLFNYANHNPLHCEAETTGWMKYQSYTHFASYSTKNQPNLLLISIETPPLFKSTTILLLCSYLMKTETV